MTVRTMTIADYDAVLALWRELPGIGLREFDDSLEGLGRFLRRNPATNFVAEEGGLLTGAILCGNDGRRAYIYHAAVRNNHQGLGIGRTLVEKAVEALQREGIRKAAVLVFSDNEGGNAFWEKLGFTPRPDLTYRDRFFNQ